MEHLGTPAFLVFCHQLAAIGLLSFVQTHSPTLPLFSATSSDLQAAVPPAVLSSLQLILFFASLMHGEPLVVVPVATITATLLPSALPTQARSGGSSHLREVHFTRLQIVRPSFHAIPSFHVLLHWTGISNLCCGKKQARGFL
jgi:hypothetical protein